MENLFVGIDVSKDVFDVAILDHKGNIIDKGLQFTNDKDGLKLFDRKLKSTKFDFWVCLENTGCYAYYICMFLNEKAYSFSVINPLEIKRSIGIIRGKNDEIDAYRIARYAQMNQHQLVPYKMPVESIRRLKEYIGTRELAVKQKVQLMNRIKALKITNKTTSIDELIALEQDYLKMIKLKVSAIEKLILELINENTQVFEMYHKITKIKGVGMITAVLCIIETHCFQHINKARSFACHCGVAPFKYESGSSVRGKTRTSRFRKKELKTVLFQAASSAIQHDPQLKRYYKRKKEEGKHSLTVLNAVANKLILRIFAVALRDEPWIELAA
jgi:transposase